MPFGGIKIRSKHDISLGKFAQRKMQFKCTATASKHDISFGKFAE